MGSPSSCVGRLERGGLWGNFGEKRPWPWFGCGSDDDCATTKQVCRRWTMAHWVLFLHICLQSGDWWKAYPFSDWEFATWHELNGFGKISRRQIFFLYLLLCWSWNWNVLKLVIHVVDVMKGFPTSLILEISCHPLLGLLSQTSGWDLEIKKKNLEHLQWSRPPYGWILWNNMHIILQWSILTLALGFQLGQDEFYSTINWFLLALVRCGFKERPHSLLIRPGQIWPDVSFSVFGCVNKSLALIQRI